MLVFTFVSNKLAVLPLRSYPTFETTSNKQSHENTIITGQVMYRMTYALHDVQIMCA